MHVVRSWRLRDFENQTQFSSETTGVSEPLLPQLLSVRRVCLFSLCYSCLQYYYCISASSELNTLQKKSETTSTFTLSMVSRSVSPSSMYWRFPILVWVSLLDLIHFQNFFGLLLACLALLISNLILVFPIHFFTWFLFWCTLFHLISCFYASLPQSGFLSYFHHSVCM